MHRKKMIFRSGLGIFLAIFIFAGFPESNAQTNPTLDLSQPKLRDRIQGSGFITAKPILSWGSIVGTKDAGVNLVEGEVVYIKLESGKEVQPGDRFTIFRQEEAVIHPLNKRKLGHLVLVPGELTILERKDHLLAARINKSYQPIYQGDMIIPARPILPQELPIRGEKKIEGIVLLSPDKAENITEKEFVIIDRGNQDGVIVGDFFSIYQLGHFSDEMRKEPKAKLPLAKVGEAVVVSVQEETSTVLITHSSQAIYIGDKVVSGRQ